MCRHTVEVEILAFSLICHFLRKLLEIIFIYVKFLLEILLSLLLLICTIQAQ